MFSTLSTKAPVPLRNASSTSSLAWGQKPSCAKRPPVCPASSPSSQRAVAASWTVRVVLSLSSRDAQSSQARFGIRRLCIRRLQAPPRSCISRTVWKGA